MKPALFFILIVVFVIVSLLPFNISTAKSQNEVRISVMIDEQMSFTRNDDVFKISTNSQNTIRLTDLNKHTFLALSGPSEKKLDNAPDYFYLTSEF